MSRRPNRKRHPRQNRPVTTPSDSSEDSSDSSANDSDASENGGPTYEEMMKALRTGKKDAVEEWIKAEKVRAVLQKIDGDAEKMTRMALALIGTNDKGMLESLGAVVSDLEDKGKEGAPGMRCILDALTEKPKFLDKGDMTPHEAKKIYQQYTNCIFGYMSNLEQPSAHQVGWGKFSENPSAYYFSMAMAKNYGIKMEESDKIALLEVKKESCEELAIMEAGSQMASALLQYQVPGNPFWYFDRPNGCDSVEEIYDEMFGRLLIAVMNAKDFAGARRGLKFSGDNENDDSSADEELGEGAVTPTACESWFCFFLSNSLWVDKIGVNHIDQLLDFFFEMKQSGTCTVDESDQKIINIACECKPVFAYDDNLENAVYGLMQKYPHKIAENNDLLSSVIQRWLSHPTYIGYVALTKMYPVDPGQFQHVFEKMFDYVDNSDYRQEALDLLRQAAIVDSKALQRHHVLVLEKFMGQAESSDGLQALLIIVLTIVENRVELIEGLGGDYLDMVVAKGLDETCLSLVSETLVLRATISRSEARKAFHILFTSSSEPRFQARAYQTSVLQGMQMVAPLYPKEVRRYQPYINASKSNPLMRKEALELQAALDGKNGQKSGGACSIF